MIVTAKTIRYDKDLVVGENPYFFTIARKGDIEDIKLEKFEGVCCDGMRDAIDNGFINLERRDRTANMCIFRVYFYPSGDDIEAKPIIYCPWCREEIVMKIIDEEERE